MNTYYFRSFSGYPVVRVVAPDVVIAFRLFNALHPFTSYIAIETNLVSGCNVTEEIVYGEVTSDGDQPGEAA